jgi:hypothetical protein
MPTINSLLPPYPTFRDAQGNPLNGGFVYIGQPGLEARTTPKASFFDEALTIPTGTASGAAVRTSAGYPVGHNGSPANVYVDGDYSITVTTLAGVVVYSELNTTFAFDTTVGGGLVRWADGNLGAVGAGFSNEPSTGFLRPSLGVMQTAVLGVLATEVSASAFRTTLPFVRAVNAAATAGTNAQGQGPLTQDFSVVTTAAANPSGVTLPTAVAGSKRTIVNRGANQVNVYPALGAAIGALAVNLPWPLPVGGAISFVARSATQWDVISAGFGGPLAPVAAAAQTSIDFLGIPPDVNRITVSLLGLSTNGTSPVQIQIGDSGGVENSGYLGSGGVTSGPTNLTAGFLLAMGVSDTAAALRHGSATITRFSGNTWMCTGSIGASNTNNFGFVAGSKALSDVLDRVRVTTVAGTDTFDAGSVTVSYE